MDQFGNSARVVLDEPTVVKSPNAVEYKGETYNSALSLARALNVNPSAIRRKLRRGSTVEEAVDYALKHKAEGREFGSKEKISIQRKKKRAARKKLPGLCVSAGWNGPIF